MHVVIQDQQTGDVSTLCVDRNSHTCIVLQADTEHLDDLIRIAASMKVDEIKMMASTEEQIAYLRERGWNVSTSVVMVRNGRK